MTEMMKKALEAVQTWSPERQDEAAELLLLLAEQEDGVHELSADEQRILAASKAAVRRGEFATEEEVEAAFQRFRK